MIIMSLLNLLDTKLAERQAGRQALGLLGVYLGVNGRLRSRTGYLLVKANAPPLL